MIKKVNNGEAVVISLGGSMLFANGTIDTKYVSDFCELAKNVYANGFPIAIVVGGGKTAGMYANAVRELTESEFYADRLGIDVTKLNAKLVIATLGDAAFPKVLKDIDDAVHAFREGLIPVSAGLLEGMTTDTVAAIFAERLHACRIVNVTNIDYVYDSDPRTNPEAKKFLEMTHKQLVHLADIHDERKARTNFVFDSIAAKIAGRSKIPILFVNGRKMDQIRNAIEGRPIEGTTVNTPRE
ncbi:TPA: UMP kinase [Candidatus Micrarchaeota archaeon]|nr:MAG: hypothetical protein AUJ65_04870 [Candidatus Micrarchaeota archaeon CG1_02_51_15]HII39095.1 UMP kinase [Candidatus Micrarchaeota archaeon]